MNDVTIVGGGFTGIVISAYFRNKKVRLYEASSKVGGILRDIVKSNESFFSACQYLDAESSWLRKFKLSNDFYKFEHRYGSYTDIFGEITTSSSFAGPVFSGSFDSALINSCECTNLQERLNIYPDNISKPLSRWFRSIGIDTEITHHSATVGFQASRIYCANMYEKIRETKANSELADGLYALPRLDLGLNKIQSLLPSKGFNFFLDSDLNKFNLELELKKTCKPIYIQNKIFLSDRGHIKDPGILVWTANPTPLIKAVMGKRLDSIQFRAEILVGLLDKKVEYPFYVQVYSSRSRILRIYIYNINGQGAFTIEKAQDQSGSKLVLEQAESIINNFKPCKFSRLIARSKSARFFAYSVRDYICLKEFQSACLADNLIVPNFLAYGRNQKIQSIIDQSAKFDRKWQ